MHRPRTPRDAGFSRHITKPVTIGKLETAIAEALGRPGSQDGA